MPVLEPARPQIAERPGDADQNKGQTDSVVPNDGTVPQWFGDLLLGLDVAYGDEGDGQQHEAHVFDGVEAKHTVLHDPTGELYFGADKVEDQAQEQLYMGEDEAQQRKFAIGISGLFGPFAPGSDDGQNQKDQDQPTQTRMGVNEHIVHNSEILVVNIGKISGYYCACLDFWLAAKAVAPTWPVGQEVSGRA